MMRPIPLLSFLKPFSFFKPSGPQALQLSWRDEPPQQEAECADDGLLDIGQVLNSGRAGERFRIRLSDYAESGDRDAILASSGMGKSYLAGVLVEEILEAGGLVFIMDPEGENYTLAERYPMLIVGGKHATVELALKTAGKADINRIVETVLREGVSVIFDLSGRKNQEKRALFTMITGSLFLAQEDPELQRPIKLIVEEARVFAPQKASQVNTVEGESSLSVFEDIATMGRKRGLHFLLATQRPASVNKDVISQCNRFWFGGAQSTQDCAAMKPYLQSAGITMEQIQALEPGQFYFYSEGKTTLIRVKKRRCRHAGKTPAASRNRKMADRHDVERIADLLSAGYDETVPNPR